MPVAGSPSQDGECGTAWDGFGSLVFRSEGATMNPNQALWEKGDFTRIAGSMRKSGEALVQGLGITKGLEVLDLGCGDGTGFRAIRRWWRRS
jgi:cyclopropane fatty-acyl-phospholipid synthase-like methyltransferase